VKVYYLNPLSPSLEREGGMYLIYNEILPLLKEKDGVRRTIKRQMN
jgi:hypothetical protein